MRVANSSWVVVTGTWSGNLVSGGQERVFSPSYREPARLSRLYVERVGVHPDGEADACVGTGCGRRVG